MHQYIIIKYDQTVEGTDYWKMSRHASIRPKKPAIIPVMLQILQLAQGLGGEEADDNDNEYLPEEEGSDDDDEPNEDDRLTEESDHEATPPSSGAAPPLPTTYWTPSSVNQTALAAVLEEVGKHCPYDE